METIKDFFEKLASESEYRPSWDPEKNRVYGDFGSIDVPLHLKAPLPDREDWRYEVEDTEYEYYCKNFYRGGDK